MNILLKYVSTISFILTKLKNNFWQKIKLKSNIELWIIILSWLYHLNYEKKHKI